jgi:hypothetical protein
MGFSLNLVLKYVRLCEIHVWSTEPDHMEWNQGLHPQIIMCDLCFLRYCAALSGNSSTNFWDSLLVPCSRVRKSKGENRTWLKLTDKIFLSCTCPLSNFLRKHDVSEGFCFQAMKHLTWCTYVIELFSITWPHRNIILLGYPPENRSSPRQ